MLVHVRPNYEKEPEQVRAFISRSIFGISRFGEELATLKSQNRQFAAEQKNGAFFGQRSA